MSWLAVYLCPCDPSGFLSVYRTARPASGPSVCLRCGAAVKLTRPVALTTTELALGITPPDAELLDRPPQPADVRQLSPQEWAARAAEVGIARA